MEKEYLFGIDPSITDTKIAVLSVDADSVIKVEYYVRSRPPSSMSHMSNEQLSCITTDLHHLLQEYKPIALCVIEDYRNESQTEKICKAKVVGCLEYICYERAYTIYKAHFSDTKSALGLKNNASELDMLNKSYEILQSDKGGLSGAYAVGAALFLCNKLLLKRKRNR